jgi:hypothetical protein
MSGLRLPDYCLTPFEAYPLDACALIHRGPGFASDAEVLSRFAYKVDVQRRADATPKIFYAERYGGSGIGHHGGGGRCGLDDGWCVKGIGRTPLIGRDVSYWYSHGGLPLVDALAETIWARWLEVALPFGVVKVGAVIEAGRTHLPAAPGEEISHPGALLVRETAMRLAGFERAIHYRPISAEPEEIRRDVDRVRHAVAGLPGFLAARGWQAAPSAVPRTLQALEETVARLAVQSANAAARQIYHGALVSSNLALDGRWIDLGSVTFLPDFALHRAFNPQIWVEYVKPLEGIREIIYYIKKYTCDLRDHDYAELVTALHTEAYQHYNLELSVQLAARTGLPTQLLRTGVAPLLLGKHAQTIQALALQLAQEAAPGRPCINDTLRIVGQSDDAAAASTGLAAIGVRGARADAFIAAHHDLRGPLRAAARGARLEEVNLDLLRCLTAHRRNELHPLLERPRLNQALMEMIEAHANGGLAEAFSAFFAKHGPQVAEIFAEAPAERVAFRSLRYGPVRFAPHAHGLLDAANAPLGAEARRHILEEVRANG